jgi:phosphatidylserine/phosphatidylglycerophosphate/cardiolipin synthase-like enzyme
MVLEFDGGIKLGSGGIIRHMSIRASGKGPMLLRPGDTCWRRASADRAAVLIDSAAYFAAAKSAMAKAKTSIHLLGWAFDPLTQLEPDAQGGGSTKDQVGDFLKDLALNRPSLDVRVLIWKSALPIAASQHFFPHRARACFRNTPVSFRLDAAVPLGACHHQKVLVIDDRVAFCGGGDITTDRWDTPEHLDDDSRRRMPFGGIHDPRHEVMMCVEGEAAQALGELFRRRWRRATAADLPDPAPDDRSASPWPDGLASPFTGVTVGIARTEPAWKRYPEVRESEALHLAGIAAAKRYIYLENQYVASPVIGEALAARLEEADGPEVVIVSTEHSPSWFDRLTMDKTRSALLGRLQAADRWGRFHAYCPETRAGKTIIVHCKATVIDDQLLRVGSTNLNMRSAGFDSECDMAIEAEAGPAGAQTRAAIAAHRTRTLAHFLGRTPAEVDAAIASTGGLAAAVEALDTGPQRRLRRLGPVRIGPVARLIATFHLGDPTAPTDSWRPWRRRAAILAYLDQVAPELAAAALSPKGAASAPTDEASARPASPPTLHGEDFIQSD